MDSYCSSCREVARQLRLLLETRRRGQLFEAFSYLNETPILSQFGTIGEISKRNRCPSCRDLNVELSRWETLYGWTRINHQLVAVEIHDPRPYSYSRLQPPLQTLYLCAVDPNEKRPSCFVNLLPLETGAPHDMRGRLFDRHEMSFDLVIGWLQCCELTHGEKCTLGLTEHLSPPDQILLVDLESHCLSYGTLACKYATLSYVWGQVNTFRTTCASLPDLVKPGGFNVSTTDLLIPETIKDFMRLAIRLNIRYVWVDSLCIIQDSDDLQLQLNGMAAIFASAYLTIVSEGLDANSGLIGAGSGAKLRDQPCHMLRLPDMACVLKDNVRSPNDPRIWESRAWTLQEGLFSRRILWFDVFGILSWTCRMGYWSEPQIDPSESLDWVACNPAQRGYDWRFFGFSEFNFTWPDMRRWCELIEEYVPRELLSRLWRIYLPGGFSMVFQSSFSTFICFGTYRRRTLQREDKAISSPAGPFLGGKVVD